MPTERYDVVVVGGGTGGTFAAVTAARAGASVVLLERKSESEAGHIACGDAIKGQDTFPDVIDRQRLRDEAFTNEGVTHALFEVPKTGQTLDYDFGGVAGSVLDRKRYGEILLEETIEAGVDIHYDTVVNDVIQDGVQVTGVEAVSEGTPTTYEADVVIDAAGALSLLQDVADLDEATFDTNVTYSQFCSAYREVISVDEPVEWSDAIVFKPTAELGYLWYFPRTPTEINVGVGFQMTEEPMQLVRAIREDVQNRSEFENATVEDKLGAALPTRRPYDSGVAPGYIAVGDAAAHVNPTTGGGIPGAAKGGHWAGEVAASAIADGDVSEAGLWEYNHRVQTDFGKRFAAMDLYNIFGTARDIDDLVDLLAAMPAQQLIDVIGKKGEASMNLGLKLKVLVKTLGHWGTLRDVYRVNDRASELKSIYDDYPTDPDAYHAWLDRRDSFMDDYYDLVGAEPKY
ncbi:geranylgeranyl reductase family protein [Halococcoides cellulosivorans]|uniref:Electron transfer flavoprotein n=1 Tax=Halococcoides cellulosivorans TaxID=1679096 RepID=A0A2R4WZX6_9EURY|nr:geranylgeranyl reductase family protein [Halococcoides cellulosivorans]AWB27071.1 electron transfer flavoprotein [Halococcoides cellulosivorans]